MAYVRKEFTFDRVVRLGIGLAVCGAVLWLLNYLKGVLLPFAVACLLAYMMNPLVEWNKRVLRLKGRTLATILTLVEFSMVVAGILWLLIPYVYHESHRMVLMLGEYVQAQLNVPYLPAAIHEFIKQYIDLDYIQSLLTREQWMSLLSEAANQTWSFVNSTMSMVLTMCSWMLVLMYLIFILIDYDKITGGFKRAVPVRYRKITLRLLRDVKDSMNHYFRGQALIAAIVGVMFSIGFTLIGLPMGIMLGLFIGLLNMIPYLQLVSIPIATMLCLVSSVSTGGSFWEMFGWMVLVYCVVQAIQDLILTPKIMGKSMGLNPAIMLLSLSIWGALLGFIGLIVALPLTTLLLAYYDEYVAVRDKEKTSPPSVTDNAGDA